MSIAPKFGSMQGSNERRPVLAYYYPAHGAVEGLSWSEWDLIKGARPWFDGHRQPLEPSWGYLDETRPETFLMQARAALDASISGFIIDCPWRPGPEAMYEATFRRALLPALDQLGGRFRFAIMWVPVWPRLRFPASMDEPELAEPERFFPFTAGDLVDLVDFYLDPFLTHPSYLHIDGRPMFLLFHPFRLLDQLGRDGAIRALAAMRDRARKAGLPGLFLVGILNCAADARMLAGLGLDAITSYIWWPEWRGPWIQQYLELGRIRIEEWSTVQSRIEVPYLPSIATGWDATPRGRRDWDGRTPRFPWSPIVQGNTPESVASMLSEGLDFLDRRGVPSSWPIMLASWNEWSEGHFLEPCTLWGDSHLKAIAALLEKKT